jgi:hypothetical protein
MVESIPFSSVGPSRNAKMDSDVLKIVVGIADVPQRMP